jgi:very-short-patch-repair endonuclease
MRTSAVTKRRARNLRKDLSPPELKLWLRLRIRAEGEPIFRRQEPIGPFIADFYCAQARLVVEVDSSWHASDERAARDRQKDGYFKKLGLKVERIYASGVMSHSDEMAHALRAMALELIERRALQPPPSPR